MRLLVPLVVLVVAGICPNVSRADIIFNISAPFASVEADPLLPTTIDLLVVGDSTGTEFGGFFANVVVSGTTGSISGVTFSPATTPATDPFSTVSSFGDGASVTGGNTFANQATLSLGANNVFTTTATIPVGQIGSVTFGFNPAFTNFSSGGGFLPATFNSTTVNVTAAAIPEPSTTIACVFGLASIAFRRRRSC